MRVSLKQSLLLLVLLASAELYAAITVQLVKNLDFGYQILGLAKSVIVAPTDSGAASFNASGLTVGRTTTCTVTQSSITMSNGGSGATNQITVNAFRLSGCTTPVPPGGQILGIGVGATAVISANDLAGDYTGTATFRITTN